MNDATLPYDIVELDLEANDEWDADAEMNEGGMLQDVAKSEGFKFSEELPKICHVGELVEERNNKFQHMSPDLDTRNGACEWCLHVGLRHHNDFVFRAIHKGDRDFILRTETNPPFAMRMPVRADDVLKPPDTTLGARDHIVSLFLMDGLFEKEVKEPDCVVLHVNSKETTTGHVNFMLEGATNSLRSTRIPFVVVMACKGEALSHGVPVIALLEHLEGPVNLSEMTSIALNAAVLDFRTGNIAKCCWGISPVTVTEHKENLIAKELHYFLKANAQQPKLFVGMILILIFAEALALYGLIVGIILSSRAGQSRAD
eukprot:Gb_06931 [translate_table: standard]